MGCHEGFNARCTRITPGNSTHSHDMIAAGNKSGPSYCSHAEGHPDSRSMGRMMGYSASIR